MSEQDNSNPAPTEAQLEDFRNFASNYLEVSADMVKQCISYVQEGGAFALSIKDPLKTSITPDQLSDLQLYFENL